MLSLRSAKSFTHCDRLSRRQFLQVGMLGGLGLADLLRLRARAASKPAAKSVIIVWLDGGPSHIDMYDMKPEAPADYRGEFKPIQTKVPGMEICELMPLQAQIADRLAIVRGIVTHDAGHDKSTIETLTGFPDADNRPALGSVVSRLRHQQASSLPPSIRLAHRSYLRPEREPGHLGAAHAPFYVGSRYSPFPLEGGAGSLALSRGLTENVLLERKHLLASFDTIRRDLDTRDTMAAMDAFNAQALEMITSPRARDAFDLGREPDKNKEKYGKITDFTHMGEKRTWNPNAFILARRLAEAGAPVITLGTTLGWDTHNQHFTWSRNVLPLLDRAMHALITDLHERGLNDDVAVVVWGEFGRTPRINKNAGRDHFPAANFALLAGGGLKMGQVVGATTARAERPLGKPYSPQNVLATLYHVLGIDVESTTITDHQGRPVYLLEDRERIAELS